MIRIRASLQRCRQRGEEANGFSRWLPPQPLKRVRASVHCGTPGRRALMRIVFLKLHHCLEDSMFEGLFQPMHLMIIAGIALLVFGPKKLPELGKGLGESIRGFKSAMAAKEEENPRLDPKRKDRSAV
jgi:sec-independent protein translocase protein TatA